MEHNSKIEKRSKDLLMLGLNETIDRLDMAVFIGMVMC